MSSGEPELTVLLLTMNEAGALPEILERVRKGIGPVVADHEVLVIDGGSTDGTVEKAGKTGAKVSQQRSPGYGNAYRQGLAEARGRWIVTVDADGSHPPEIFDKLWALRGDWDVVMGSRYMKDSTDERAWLRRTMSIVLNFFYSKVLGVPLSDISGGYRLYRREAARIPCYGSHYETVAELIVRIWGEGFRVHEIPYVYTERDKGSSKVRLLYFSYCYVRTLISLWFWLRFGRRGRAQAPA